MTPSPAPTPAPTPPYEVGESLIHTGPNGAAVVQYRGMLPGLPIAVVLHEGWQVRVLACELTRSAQ